MNKIPKHYLMGVKHYKHILIISDWIKQAESKILKQNFENSNLPDHFLYNIILFI